MLILASASPRRKDLLTEAGYVFEIIVPDVVEAHDTAASPLELTRGNALLKARAVAAQHPERMVLGADTLVAIDDTVLGKPADLDEAHDMLTRLAGRTHGVTTSVALLHAGQENCLEITTRVTFLPLDSAGIRRYLTLINPLDKAGAYAAQEHGSEIIARVDGSWTNVVGLPMEAVTTALAAAGFHPSQPGKSYQTSI